MKKIMAVASGGGHWVELLRLRPAFEGHKVVYVTTIVGNRSAVAECRCHIVLECSRWTKIKLLVTALQLLWLLIRERPDIVITTGAAPGLLAIRIAKLFGKRTIWVDSLANADELSMSGRLAGPHVDLWLTQWPELATDKGPLFRGGVL